MCLRTEEEEEAEYQAVESMAAVSLGAFPRSEREEDGRGGGGRTDLSV